MLSKLSGLVFVESMAIYENHKQKTWEKRKHRLASVSLDTRDVLEEGASFVLNGVCGVEHTTRELEVIPSAAILATLECPGCYRREA